MKLIPFCDAFREQFDPARFDVDIDYRVDERGRIAAITVTCRGCGMFVREYVSDWEIKEDCHDGLVLDRATRIEDTLKYMCECWRLVGRRAVYISPHESIPFSKSQKRKKPIKPVVKVKRKIRS